MQQVALCLLCHGRIRWLASQVRQARPLEDEGADGGDDVVL